MLFSNGLIFVKILILCLIMTNLCKNSNLKMTYAIKPLLSLSIVKPIKVKYENI